MLESVVKDDAPDYDNINIVTSWSTLQTMGFYETLCITEADVGFVFIWNKPNIMGWYNSATRLQGIVYDK